ncbi:MAG: ketopantoate reductase family protein [Solirubrobacterales bacterium]
MKIAIIGAGAMGSLYGGYISKYNEEVYLVDIWQQHVDEINNNGLSIIEKDESIKVYPKAVSDSKDIGFADLVIVFVKSYLTDTALEMNKSLLSKDTIVLSLQNGYGNIEKISKYVHIDNVIAGTTAHGAAMVSPGVVKHGGAGETHIGWVNNKNDKRIDEVAEVLNNSGFNTTISQNVMELIWSKLIVNVGINALTALLKVQNGELLNMEETKELMEMAVVEGVNVAEKAGVKFSREDMVNKVKAVALATRENKSSMLQDILNNRKTEIDTINGAIVKEGKKYKVETPVNLVLLNLIKAQEKK